MKVTIPYEHDAADLRTVWLAVAQKPTEDDWRPAYRDMVGEQRVLWARFDTPPNRGVWIRDRDGERLVRPL